MTIVKNLGTVSKIAKSKNGWFYLIVPVEGIGDCHVKTSRKIEDCEAHFKGLQKTFPNKKY